MRTNQVIPAEAVEAAAKALYKGQPLYDEENGIIAGYKPWEWMTPEYQQAQLDEARAALEAAAPYMQERVSTLDALVLLEPGTILQGPDFHEETYKCTAPGTFHAIASTTEYRASELVGRGPFAIIYRSRSDGDD